MEIQWPTDGSAELRARRDINAGADAQLMCMQFFKWKGGWYKDVFGVCARLYGQVRSYASLTFTPT